MSNCMYSYLLYCFNRLNKAQFYVNVLSSSATQYDYIAEIANCKIDSLNTINPLAKEFYKALIAVTKPKVLR